MHTVVLATFGRAGDVQHLLECLRRQTKPPDRVIVCDDTPDDSIERLLDGYPIDHVYERNPTKPSLTRSRNLAIPHLLPGLATFLDSDLDLDDDYLESIQAGMAKRADAIGCMGWVEDFPTGGTIKDLLTAPLFITRATKGTIRRRYPLRLHYARSPPPAQDTNWLYGCNMTYRTEVFDEHCFASDMERYSYAEDIDMSTRVQRATGRPLIVIPEARLRHSINEEGRMTPMDVFRMRMIHRHIFVHQHHRIGPLRWLGLWWMHSGYVVFYSYLAPRMTGRYVKEFWRLARVLRQRRADVKAGTWGAFNDQYGFWERG